MVGKSMVSVYLPVQCIVGVYLRISIIPLFYVKLRRNDLFDPDSVYRKVVSECFACNKILSKLSPALFDFLQVLSQYISGKTQS